LFSFSNFFLVNLFSNFFSSLRRKHALDINSFHIAFTMCKLFMFSHFLATLKYLPTHTTNLKD
jgi:hypothetical protein